MSRTRADAAAAMQIALRGPSMVGMSDDEEFGDEADAELDKLDAADEEELDEEELELEAGYLPDEP